MVSLVTGSLVWDPVDHPTKRLFALLWTWKPILSVKKCLLIASTHTACLQLSLHSDSFNQLYILAHQHAHMIYTQRTHFAFSWYDSTSYCRIRNVELSKNMLKHYAWSFPQITDSGGNNLSKQIFCFLKGRGFYPHLRRSHWRSTWENCVIFQAIFVWCMTRLYSSLRMYIQNDLFSSAPQLLIPSWRIQLGMRVKSKMLWILPSKVKSIYIIQYSR